MCPRNFRAVFYFMNNSKIDDLHVFSETSEGIDCIAKICPHDKEGIRNPGQVFTLDSLVPACFAYKLMVPD